MLELAKFEPTGIPVFLVDALRSENEITRLHAQRALERSLVIVD